MSQPEVLQIDTKGICILCYNCVDIDIPGQASHARLSSSQGFKLLLRYLNVNPRELFNCSEDFLESMDMSVNIDLQINLCSDCSLVTQTFDQLYKDYELIQLQFDDCVRSIHKSMETGDMCSERVREYKRQMQPYLSTQLVNASIAANLRKETFKKCAAKLKSSIPHVTIPKYKIPDDPLIANVHTVDLDIDTNPRSSTLLESMFNPLNANISNNVITADILDVEDSLSAADDEISNDSGDDYNDETHTSRITGLSSAQSGSPNIRFEGRNLCEICNTDFRKRQTLTRHRATVHMGYLIYKQFPFKSSLWTEENCSQAAKDCIDEIIRRNNLEGESQYKCCYCSKVLTKRVSLKIHTLSLHKNKFCGEVRRNLRLPDDDLQLQACAAEAAPAPSGIHRRINKRCHICMKLFESVQLLLEHQRLHHFNKQGSTDTKNQVLSKKIQCQSCEYQFSTLGSFQLHMLMIHTLESVMKMLPPNTCRDECGTAVDSVLEWISNIGSQCPHCDFTFTHLKGHMLGQHFKEFVEQVQALLQSIGTKDEGENLHDPAPLFQSQEDIIEIDDEDTEMKIEFESHNETDPLA